MDNPKRNHPLWETLVIAGSFILLWVWFLLRQVGLRTGTPMWRGWQALLAIALVALVVITVRRLQRVQRSFRGSDDEKSTTPWKFPPPNGHSKK
jgi:type VI protein secretion system component VasK